MEIITTNLIPKPLADISGLNSEIWLNNNMRFLSESLNIIYSESGKGKTSLLSIFYGIRKDYNGKVFFDGEDIADFSYDKWVKFRRERISIVFQGLNLFDNLTVEENILLKNKLTDYYKKNEIIEMTERIGIGHLRNKKVGLISFGQKQRVAVLRALCQPFELLLLDEPFSHLDADNQAIVFDMVLEKAKDNKAGVILTSLSRKTVNESVDFNFYRI